MLVRFLPRRLGGGLPQLCLAIALAVLMMSMAAVLAFGLDFDLEASPAWQVGFYHLMLGLVAALPASAALHPVLRDFGRFRQWLLVVVLLAPVFALAFGWFHDGAYSGFRDPRLMPMVLGSSSLSVMLLGTVGLLKGLVLFAVYLCRLLERPMPAFPGLSWLLPGVLRDPGSAESDGAAEGEVRG